MCAVSIAKSDFYQRHSRHLDANTIRLRKCVFSLENSDSFYENHENTLYPQTRITKKGYDNERADFETPSLSLHLQDMFWKMLTMKKSLSKFIKFVKVYKPEPKFIKVYKREQKFTKVYKREPKFVKSL